MVRRGAGRLAGGVALGVLGAAAGLAQVDPPGGIDLGFVLDQQIIASDNAALDPDPQGTTLRSDTSLGFRLSSETRIDTLALTADTIYRYADGPGTSTNGFTDPSYTLSYARQGFNSAATADLSYQSSDIAFRRSLADVIDPITGQPPIGFDPADLRGTGQVTDIRASATLALGQQGPFGATFRLDVSETNYQNVSSPTLVDVSRQAADLDLRFALTGTTAATLALGYSQIDPDGPQLFETKSVDLGVAIQQRAGALSFDLGYADTESGDQYSVSVGRQITLPRGGISATLGATRDPAGQTSVSGSLSLQRTFRNAALDLSFDRSSRATDQGQRLVTSLSASYARPLTNRTNLTLDAAYVLSEDTAANTDSAAADLGATLGYQLTRDWTLDLGYTYRRQSQTGFADAAENAISLGIGRSFSIRVR